MFKRTAIILGIFVFQGLLVSSAFAVSIPIDNYSFEDPVIAAGAWTQGVPIPGWTSSDVGMSGVISGYGTASDGNNAAWVQGTNSIWQILPETLQPNATYTLGVSVGTRANWGTDAEIQLLAGGNILADLVLTNDQKPAGGTYSVFTLTYQSGSSVAPDQNLEVKLISTGDPDGWNSQPHFDDVTLDGPSNGVVPEPATVSLLGLGALGLFFRRKKVV